jgi:hypothetical protein
MAVSGGVGKNAKKKAPAKKGANPFQKSGGGSMICPECGKPMPVGGTCKNCGYVDKGGGKKAPPMKKSNY